MSSWSAQDISELKKIEKDNYFQHDVIPISTNLEILSINLWHVRYAMMCHIFDGDEKPVLDKYERLVFAHIRFYFIDALLQETPLNEDLCQIIFDYFPLKNDGLGDDMRDPYALAYESRREWENIKEEEEE